MAGLAFVEDQKWIKVEEKKRKQDAEKALQKAQEEKKAGANNACGVRTGVDMGKNAYGEAAGAWARARRD